MSVIKTFHEFINESIWSDMHDRDINAAKNILEEGKKIIGLSSPEFKRVGEQALASSMNLEQNVK